MKWNANATDTVASLWGDQVSVNINEFKLINLRILIFATVFDYGPFALNSNDHHLPLSDAALAPTASISW